MKIFKNKKVIIIVSVVLIAAILASVFMIKRINQKNNAWDTDNDGVLEILAIGNSFSSDALAYVYKIAFDMGIKKIVVANLVIGGCSLELHAANAKGDRAAYAYNYDEKGMWEAIDNYKSSTALTSRTWDYVSLQQVSGSSGKAETYNEDLEYMINYVKEKAPGAKLVWHMTGAYQQNSTKTSFGDYDFNQMTMYNAITSAVQSKISPNENIDIIVPAGTAVQNARTSSIGDNITRDGFHLSYDFGCYLAGLMFVRSVTGLPVDDVEFMPRGVEETERIIAVKAVEEAWRNPFEVTTIEK